VIIHADRMPPVVIALARRIDRAGTRLIRRLRRCGR
jgi:hypothetical protein